MTISSKRVKFALALLLTMFIAVDASRTAVAGDYTVVPGRSVGKIRLGATRSAVLAILGKPSESTKWRSGPTQDTWMGSVPPNNRFGYADSPRTYLNVIYKNNIVVQIEFNSPKFKTTSGVSVSSSLAQFRAKYANPRVRAYGYEDPNGGGAVLYYYDNVKKGIAFTFGVQDNFDAQKTPDSLRIHLAGTPVLPDPGGKPMKANDEVPVGPQQ